MFNTIIIENFFDNFEYLENHFKKIPLLKYNSSFSAISGYNLNSKTSHKRVITNQFNNNKINFIENITLNDKIRKKKYLLTRLR